MNAPRTNGARRHRACSAKRPSLSLPADSELWTTTEVRDYLRVSLKTVFNLRKRGLPYVQLGGAIRFVPQEIKDYLARNRGLSAHRLRQMIRKGERR